MSLDLIRQKLEQLNNQQDKKQTSTKREWEWKPSPGDNLIRILPYKHNENNDPFIGLWLYYQQFGKQLVSPVSPHVDKSDPVIEFLNELPTTNVPKDVWVINKNLKDKLKPTLRCYVPILVRGKEHEGVKFWGFGQGVYDQLREYFEDSDWGNLASLKEGRDLTVNFTPKDENVEKSFPKTKVTPKPKVTPATEDSVVLDKIKNMIRIEDEFTVPTYDELKEMLRKYLDVSTTETKTPSVNKNVQPNKDNVHSGWEVEKTLTTKEVDEVVKNAVDELDALFEQKFN